MDDEIQEPEGFLAHEIPGCPFVAFDGWPFSGCILLGETIGYLRMAEGSEYSGSANPLDVAATGSNHHSRQNDGDDSHLEVPGLHWFGHPRSHW